MTKKYVLPQRINVSSKEVIQAYNDVKHYGCLAGEILKSRYIDIGEVSTSTDIGCTHNSWEYIDCKMCALFKKNILDIVTDADTSIVKQRMKDYE